MTFFLTKLFDEPRQYISNYADPGTATDKKIKFVRIFTSRKSNFMEKCINYSCIGDIR